MRIEMIAVQTVEPRGFIFFLAIQLNDSHGRQSFLKEGVDPCEPGSDFAISFADARAKKVRHQRNERNHQVRDESKPPIHHEHRNADCNEREQIAQTGYDARAEELVQRFDIRRNACDQTARRIAIEKWNRQALKVRENLHAQVAHHALAEETGKPGFSVRADELQGERPEEKKRACPDDGKIVARERDIDDALSEDRARKLKHSLETKKNESACDEGLVRTHVREQTTHQTSVVRFTECFLLVQGCGVGHQGVC